jgi:2-polyprenyl-3-methyl-5-hydroxy-6-metoxy-1,4-benzoquinol methylase
MQRNGSTIWSQALDELKKEVIKSFWRNQSRKASNRWTSDAVLDFETSYLMEKRNQLKNTVNILDLGSGAGELSKSIQKPGDFLTAVDYEENFSRFFEKRDNQTFQATDLTEFESQERFDLILLFGVVNYLTKEEESKVYRVIHEHLASIGVAIIKHQVSYTDEIIINTYSNELESQYSARYPSHKEQVTELKTLFGNVEILEYNQKFNKFEDTFQAAYFVKKN